MSENPVLKDATRARSILAPDCGSTTTKAILIEQQPTRESRRVGSPTR